jgi:hypothetical protein
VARYALIDGYLDSMRANIRWRRDLDDVVAEMEDHLYSTVEYMLARGSDQDEAQRSTLARFGDPKILVAAFASNDRGGLAVPTTFTHRAGLFALVAAALWLFNAALYTAMWNRDSWELLYLVFTITVVSAGVLGVIAMVGVSKRIGGLGIAGLVGIAVTSVGVLLSVVAWATPVWMGVQGVGFLVFGIAALSSDLPPRAALALLSAGFIVGTIAWFVANTLEVGSPDSYGDHIAAWAIGVAVGAILLAGGLFGLGRWLRSEVPVDVDPTPVAA